MDADAAAFEMWDEFNPIPRYHLKLGVSGLRMRWIARRLARAKRRAQKRGTAFGQQVTIRLTRPLSEESGFASIGMDFDQVDYDRVGKLTDRYFEPKGLKITGVVPYEVDTVEVGLDCAFDSIKAGVTVA